MRTAPAQPPCRSILASSPAPARSAPQYAPWRRRAGFLYCIRFQQLIHLLRQHRRLLLRCSSDAACHLRDAPGHLHAQHWKWRWVQSLSSMLNTACKKRDHPEPSSPRTLQLHAIRTHSRHIIPSFGISFLHSQITTQDFGHGLHLLHLPPS